MARLGIIITILGLICFGGGLVLLAWRLIEPDNAVLLPPDESEDHTPTPGLLGSPLAPPLVPTGTAVVAMLPVSNRPTGTAQPITSTIKTSPTDTPSNTPSASPTETATPTRTLPASTSIIASHTPTATYTAAPSPTLTPSPLPSLPDRIIIDAIGLDAPIIPVGQHALQIGEQTYSQWDVPNVFAVGWHQNSAALGQPGNTVLNGHHNIYGEVFRYLVELKPGDIVTLESQGKRFFYLVAQTMTLAEEEQPIDVRQANARWILPTIDERVTLITCWPYRTSTHRLVVIALPPAALGLPAEIP